MFLATWQAPYRLAPRVARINFHPSKDIWTCTRVRRHDLRFLGMSAGQTATCRLATRADRTTRAATVLPVGKAGEVNQTFATWLWDAMRDAGYPPEPDRTQAGRTRFAEAADISASTVTR